MNSTLLSPPTPQCLITTSESNVYESSLAAWPVGVLIFPCFLKHWIIHWQDLNKKIYITTNTVKLDCALIYLRVFWNVSQTAWGLHFLLLSCHSLYYYAISFLMVAVCMFLLICGNAGERITCIYSQRPNETDISLQIMTVLLLMAVLWYTIGIKGFQLHRIPCPWWICFIIIS